MVCIVPHFIIFLCNSHIYIRIQAWLHGCMPQIEMDKFSRKSFVKSRNKLKSCLGAVSVHYGIIPIQARLTRNNLSWLALTDATFVHCM
jgi:hypothetical protein